MRRLTQFMLKRRIIIMITTIILTVVAVYGSTKVIINENILDYIPKEIESIEAGDIISNEFRDLNTISLLLRDVTISERDKILSNLVGKNSIITNSEKYIKQDNSDTYLVTLVLSDNYDEKSLTSLIEYSDNLLLENNIKGGLVPGTVYFTSSDDTTALIVIITFAVISFVIMLFSKSNFDFILILGNVGIAVILNLGTNIFFGEISYVSFSAAALIQLAVSIDYSLFILTKYREGRNNGLQLNEAIEYSMSKGTKSVFAGALTTIAGFAALLLMKYELGMDLGLVLAKGVLISLTTAIVLMPIFISLAHKILEKTEHKSIMPKFKFISKSVGSKRSLIVVILAMILSSGAYLIQSDTDFIYGESSMSKNEMYIDENFDLSNLLVVLIPNNKSENIDAFRDKLLTNVDGLIKEDLTLNKKPIVYWQEILGTTESLLLTCTFQSEYLPESTCDYLPEVTLENSKVIAEKSLKTQGIFKSTFINNDETYQRIFIEIKDDKNTKESDDIFETIAEIRLIANDIFDGEAKLTGESVALYDLKEISTEDSKIVSIVTIILVSLVVLITFKSISIPIILVLNIQSAIWLNMSFANITNSTLLFIGYIIVSSVQLGATIDYSIFITENYTHYRYIDRLKRKEAIDLALKDSIHPVLVSALALALGGFVLMLMTQGSIREIGLLIGRGALMSILLSILVLPHLLYIFDRFIKKTTMIKTK